MTYRVRNLYCISCDESVRVRNQIIDDNEVSNPCPECAGGLVDIGRVNLKWPEISTSEIVGEVISIVSTDQEISIQWRFTDPWQS